MTDWIEAWKVKLDAAVEQAVFERRIEASSELFEQFMRMVIAECDKAPTTVEAVEILVDLRKHAVKSQRQCLLKLKVPETKRLEAEHRTRQFFSRFYFDWIDDFIAAFKAAS